MVEISNFELQKSYIPQKKAENVYKTDSARKNMIFYNVLKNVLAESVLFPVSAFFLGI